MLYYLIGWGEFQLEIEKQITLRIRPFCGQLTIVLIFSFHFSIVMRRRLVLYSSHCLFYKSKLDAVLFARDKWLQPHGIVFPNRFLLFIAAVKDGHSQVEHIGFWNHNHHQFDVSAMRRKALDMPILKNIAANQVGLVWHR